MIALIVRETKIPRDVIHRPEPSAVPVSGAEAVARAGAGRCAMEAAASAAAPEDVLAFWFGDGATGLDVLQRQLWFARGSARDAADKAVAARFGGLAEAGGVGVLVFHVRRVLMMAMFNRFNRRG